MSKKTVEFEADFNLGFEMVEVNPTNGDVPTHGHCGSCDWSGLLEGLEQELESEGWEYPSYYVSLCPECGDALDDYYCG